MRFGNDKSAVFTNATGSTGRVSGFADMAISFETLLEHYRLKEMGEAQNLLPKLQVFPEEIGFHIPYFPRHFCHFA
jgi:hypothetical protein